MRRKRRQPLKPKPTLREVEVVVRCADGSMMVQRTMVSTKLDRHLDRQNKESIIKDVLY